MSSSRAVTVIVPVYGDWPSLQDCIDSLKQYVDTSRHKVLLVNDCGPEVEMLEQNIKQRIADWPNTEYHRNPGNLGFVKNCNRAVNELDTSDNDVLLLNSDAKVTEGFLDEMLAVLESDEKIGAVSPRSNNATIATVPLSAAKQKGIDPEESFAIFLKIKDVLPRFNRVPVAHGFCMLIRRSLIQQYGLFDEVFDKGYGEETDFCMRIAAHGYYSVLSNRAYVYHQEARSFTLELKSKLLETNNVIIDARYPGYRRLVRDYTLQALVRENAAAQPPLKRFLIVSRGKLVNVLKRHERLRRIAVRARTKLRK